ncbi:MAG: phage baseplate assembly protein W [Ascidiaceihabitans sp.]|jgi:phage baseplate assembly protein W
MTSPLFPGHPIGFPLLATPDDTGTWRWPNLEQSVRDTLRAILMTRPGEWLLHRGRGVGLVEFLHQPNTAETRKNMHDLIRREIGLLEKRIRLDGVDIIPTGERENEIAITLRYRILRTGTAATQTVSMNLTGAS